MKKKRKEKRNGDLKVDIHSVRNRKANAFVEYVFASGWLLRKRDPDYGLDYDIERVEKGPTGRFAWVQQKTPEVVEVKNGRALYPVENKYFRYWAKNDRPVFVFLVDVAKQRGFWIFIQEWMDKSGKQFVSGSTTTLDIPENQTLDDMPQFLSAFERAIVYMREKHPGSVGAAIKYDAASVGKIDVRFHVGLEIFGAKKYYTLKPNSPVEFRVASKNNLPISFADLENYGRPLRLTTDDYKFEGLPIFDELTNRGLTGQLMVRNGETIAVKSIVDFELNGSSYSLAFDGLLTKGRSGMMFDGTLSGAPLSNEFRFEVVANEVRATECGMSFDFGTWTGKPVRSLPSFNLVKAFLTALAGSNKIRQHFLHEGQRLCGGVLHNSEKPFGDVLPFIHAIDRARQLCERFAISPVLPPVEKLSNHAIAEIDRAYEISEGREYKCPANGRVYSGTLDSKVDVSRFGDKTPGRFSVTGGGTATILDTVINLGPTETEIDSVEVAIEQKGPGEFRFHAKSSPGSTVIEKRVKEFSAPPEI